MIVALLLNPRSVADREEEKKKSERRKKKEETSRIERKEKETRRCHRETFTGAIHQISNRKRITFDHLLSEVFLPPRPPPPPPPPNDHPTTQTKQTMSRSRSRSIPQRVDSPSQHSIQNLATTLAGSFQPSSHIAQEALARDLAAEQEGSDCTYESFVDDSPFDDDDDEDDNGVNFTDHDPIMYRRPSGVAYGTTRPALGPRPVGMDLYDASAAVLTHDERVQSRNEELSLLRDNHILPPKHPVPEPGEEGWPRRVYKAMFSTKVPIKPEDEEYGGGSPLSRVASERSALLGANGGGYGANGNGGHGHNSHEGPVAGAELAEQWDAAVSAGQIKTTWQREAKTIAVYSRSLIITFLLQYSINVASIFAVGHIGKIELGAVSREFFFFTHTPTNKHG